MKKIDKAQITRALNKTALRFKKHSPEILVCAGIVGVVASGVIACKATTKASAIIEEAREQVNTVHECLEISDKYSEEDSKKDLALIYVQTGVKFAKLYGPSIILGATSIAAILAAHNIMRKRNVALMAAYTTVDRSFKEYRNRVVDRFGKDLDRELRHNIKAKEVEETVVEEDGSETVNKKIVDVIDDRSYAGSEYARFFAEGCKGWTKDAELNRFFLLQQQNGANEMLKSRGYLYLNDVYEMLGIPKTKEGHVVGWIYDENDPDNDNFVDFGIYDVWTPNEKLNESRRDFVNGFERNILLDFNVRGNIYELLF